MPEPSITAVQGFRAAALHCGIKASGKPDLALLASTVPATAAAVFTQNAVVGAPVTVGRKNIKAGFLHACIVNSGCANVCTGERGIADALQMCKATADCLKTTPKLILPFSTGVIGHFLPMDKINAGIPIAAERLSNSPQAGEDFAQGILTTDLVKKTAYARLKIAGKTVTIAGCCKGSGMIAPNMATMLAFIATDAAIALAPLQKLLKQIADQTFNCVTVDQHTSTSDTLAIMANGMAGNRTITGGNDLDKFAKALYEVSDSLSRQIARDGEGATKLVTVRVIGAASPANAKRAAEAIANSPLCKTAIHGSDPNWGRFVSAAGYSGARMNVDQALCKIGAIAVFKNGRPTAVDLAKVEAVMKQENLTITVDLGTGGPATHRVYTCDLSREYITINADYHT